METFRLSSPELSYFDHLLRDLPGFVDVQDHLGVPDYGIERSAFTQAAKRGETNGKVGTRLQMQHGKTLPSFTGALCLILL